MEAKMGCVVDVTNVFNPFDFEVLFFQKTMWAQVVKVIKPCIYFLIAYDLHQVHNMLTIMLDPCFKSLQVFQNYVGYWNVIRLVIEYDVKQIIPLLMIIFDVLNPIVQASTTQVDGSYVGVVVKEEDNNISSVSAYIEESSCALVVGELFLFRRLFIVLTTCVNPFALW
jgi:hypothetical protein